MTGVFAALEHVAANQNGYGDKITACCRLPATEAQGMNPSTRARFVSVRLRNLNDSHCTMQMVHQTLHTADCRNNRFHICRPRRFSGDWARSASNPNMQIHDAGTEHRFILTETSIHSHMSDHTRNPHNAVRHAEADGILPAFQGSRQDGACSDHADTDYQPADLVCNDEQWRSMLDTVDQTQ